MAIMGWTCLFIHPLDKLVFLLYPEGLRWAWASGQAPLRMPTAPSRGHFFTPHGASLEAPLHLIHSGVLHHA